MIRIGCDVLDVTRFGETCLDLDDPFVTATYSPEEISAASRLDQGQRRRSLAVWFSAKEAAFKCLHLDDDRTSALEARLGRRLRLRDISIDTSSAWPDVSFAADVACDMGIRTSSLSISWEGSLVMCVCAIEVSERP